VAVHGVESTVSTGSGAADGGERLIVHVQPLLWPVKGDAEVLSSTTQQHAHRSPALASLCHAYTVYGRMHEPGLTVVAGRGEQLMSIPSLFPPSLWSSYCFPPSNPSCPPAPRAQPCRRPFCLNRSVGLLARLFVSEMQASGPHCTN